MRPVSLMQKAQIKDPAAQAAFEEIERASRVSDIVTIAQNFKVTNPPATPVRTFDATTPTLATVAQVLATLLSDHQKGGSTRTT
jgi:hypothetical protein